MGWTDDQGSQRAPNPHPYGIDRRFKTPTALDPHSKLSPTYGRTNEQSHLRVNGPMYSHPQEGRTMNKVTYRWTDNQNHLRVNKWTNSPKGCQSNVKSSPRRTEDDQSYIQVANDQSCLRWTVQSISLPTYGWTNEPSHPWVSYISLPTYGWTNELSHLRVPW